jgi:hypothetical protein
MIRLCALMASLLLVHSTVGFAQQVTGVVKEESSRTPVVNALVITSQSTLSTNNQGAFTLSQAKVGYQQTHRYTLCIPETQCDSVKRNND